MISLRQENMTETENLSLQHHHLWIFLSQAIWERLIYRIAGNSAVKNTELMNALKKVENIRLQVRMKAQLVDFYGNYATEEEVADTIKRLYENENILLIHIQRLQLRFMKSIRHRQKMKQKTVIASTASPYKFTRSVMNDIDSKYDTMGIFELADELCKLSGVKVPQAIEEIRTAPVLHNTICETNEMSVVVQKNTWYLKQ